MRGILAWRAVALALYAACLLTAVRAGLPAAAAGGQRRLYPAGYNLVSAPPGSSLAAAAALFTLQAQDNAFRSLDPQAATGSGAGYWAYFATDTTVQLDEGSQQPLTVAAPADHYLQIGNPSGILPAVVTGADVVYAYRPGTGYQATTTLQPGDGAWAYRAAGGPITITPLGAQDLHTLSSLPAHAGGVSSAPFSSGHGYVFQPPDGWHPAPRGARGFDALFFSPDGAQQVSVQITPLSAMQMASPDLALAYCTSYLMNYSQLASVTNATVSTPARATNVVVKAAGQAVGAVRFTDAAGIDTTVTLLVALRGTAVYLLVVQTTTDFAAANLPLIAAVQQSFQLVP